MTAIHLAAGAPRFPARLSTIPSPPTGLWIAGHPEHLPSPSTRAVAVVGCRAASRDGLDAARRMAGALAGAGVTVVSGLARGIDAAAHQATLDAGGRTIAVLGSGLARPYPPEHAALADAIAASGAVVSEFPPDTPPRPWTFPLRNRLIAGLADAVVVVEAPERSGALITASAALDQGREVLVVPGRVGGGRNRGGHRLIRDGARLVESADDVLEDLGWTPAGAIRDTGARPEPVEVTVDELAARSGEPAQVVLARLLQLELDGEVQRIGSARFLCLRGRVLT